MGIFFLDSNVIIKYYFSEPGSIWVRQLVDSAENSCIISEIAISEVASALSQLSRHKIVGRRFVAATFEKFSDDIRNGMFLKYFINTTIVESATRLALVHPIKAYDAIQVASALSAQHNLPQPVTFVSGDKQALSAAQNEGLLCDNPFSHASPADSERPKK